MTKLVVYTDLHIGAPNCVYTEGGFATLVNKDLNEGKTVILLGDIFDLANCKKSEVKKYKTLAETYREVANRPYSKLEYILGNHERLTTKQEMHIQGRAMFVHGDMMDNPKRWAKYRAKKHGAGWFKRKLWVSAVMLFEKMVNRSPGKRLLNNVVDTKKSLTLDGRPIDTCVMGHFHYNEDMTYKGVRVVILDQGRHEITV